MSVRFRRYISTASGEVDCANPGALQCVVAFATISDYDESATADVWFDPTVGGVRAPLITLSQTDSLNDGAVVTVSGSGFPADAPVIIGGSSSIHGCWDETARLADVVADADGAFSVEVEVRRVAFDGSDCFGSLYGCRVAARSDSVSFTLVDGEVVALSLGNLTTLANCVEQELVDVDGEVFRFQTDCEEVSLDEGTVVAVQCVDLALGEEYCTDPVGLVVTDGTATGDVAVQRFFMSDSGERVDCAEPGRICELRLTGDISGHESLRFAGDG